MHNKGVVQSDGRIDEDVFRWFGNVERMENERILKRVYVADWDGSSSLGKPRKI